MADDDLVKIDFKTQWWVKHDISTKLGRLRHWFRIADPLKCFVGEKELRDNQILIDKAASQSVDGVGRFTREEAASLQFKKVQLLSCIHPDTGDVVPFFARSSAFVVSNIPIVTAMMLSPPTIATTVFWQWVNQTYNAVFNFGNRNASSTITDRQMAESYALACGSSITAALTLRKMTNIVFGNRTGLLASVANSIVVYGAVAFSSSLNVYCMRKTEMDSGVSVMEPDTMQSVGKSKVAAEMAIRQTIIGRVVYCVPIFFTKPVLEGIFSALKILPKNKVLRFFTDLSFITFGLWLAVPVNGCLYPQYSPIGVDKLEPEIKERCGTKFTHLVYNKGV